MRTRVSEWLRRAFHRPARLKAPDEPTSWVGLLLVIVQSAALVLVFGHTEIFRLFAADMKTVAVAAISLFVLVASTFAGDVTVSKVMRRIGPLRRMQEEALAGWLIVYSVFILGVEGCTFAVALWAVEQRPDALFSQTPLLPNSGPLLALQIGLRALMLPLTFVMLQITASRLELGYEVAVVDARARVGGMMRETLAETTLEASSLGDLMAAWGRLNAPMPRKRTRWNGHAIARDEEYARRLQAQTESIVAAFTQLTRDRAAEAQAEAQRQIAAAEDAAQRQIETAQREIHTAHVAATQRTLDAVLALVATGKLPDWLIVERPDLADFSLASFAGGTRRSGSGGKSLALTPAREPSSPSQRQRAFLAEQGIEPSVAPEGKRGVWLRASDLATLTGSKSGNETPQALIRRLGDGLKVGVAYVAPFEPVMRELAERHLLADAALMWWMKQTPSGDDAAADRGGNVIPMRA